MIFEELSSSQTFLGTIAFIFFVYYFFLKKNAEYYKNIDTVSPIKDEFYNHSSKTKRKSSSNEIEKITYFHRSYFDLSRSGDIHSSLNNTSSKSINKLPKEVIFLADKVNFFGHFDESILLSLFQHIKKVSLLVGEHLYASCNPNNNIIVVQSGKMEVFVIIDENNLHSIKVAKPGDSIYSLLNILEQFGNTTAESKNYYLSIVAVEDTVLLTIPISSLKKVLDKHPVALVDVVKIIGLRLQRVTLYTLKTYFGLKCEDMIANQSLPQVNTQSHSSEANIETYRICYSAEKEVVCEKCMMKLQLVWCYGVTFCRVCFMRNSFQIYKSLLNLSDEMLLNNVVKQELMLEGDVLVRQGSPLKKLYFLVDGGVQISEKHPTTLSEFLVGEFHAGSMLGSLSILTHEPSLFTYTFLTQATLFSISREDLYKGISKNPDIIIALGMIILNDLQLFVRQVDFGLEWSQLEATQSLYKQGDLSESAFVVLTGRLQSSVQQSTKSMLTGEYGRGEIVGLPETLTQVSRGSSVVAVRDSELAVLSSGLISFIKQFHPDSITALVQLLGKKILKSLPGHSSIFNMISHIPDKTEDKHLSKISTICVISISSHIQLPLFTKHFAMALNEENDSCLVLDSDKVLKLLQLSSFETASNYHLTTWLSQQEDHHDAVIYQCDSNMTLWSQKCIRQADCVLILAAAKESRHVRKLEIQLNKLPSRARKYLVLLHDLRVERPRNTKDWLKTRPWCAGHFHARCQSTNKFPPKSPLQPTPDINRLARIITNKAVGLVLGGGAARGCAHAGVVKAMLESGLPIDLVGGTSIGSIVSAIYASNNDYTRFKEEFEFFCKKRLSNLLPMLADFTFPLTSFFTGNYFNQVIKDTLGENIAIEDLWLPYFCVSTDVTMATQRVHMFGSLWRYVRASMSLGGYMPPMCDPYDGHLLLDGVYTNNLPADVMRDAMMGVKSIYAVDVGRSAFEEFSNYGDHLSGWWVLFSRLFPWISAVKVPNIIEVQARVGYVLGERHLQEVKSGRFCEYVRPPIENVGSLQFAKYDEIYELGYRYAKDYFSRHDFS